MENNDSSFGTIQEESDGTVTVQFVRELPDSPARVWRALTEPEEARTWFTAMELEPRVGGSITLDFGEEGFAAGEITGWEPPYLLEYTWTEEGHTSRVRWELADSESGTQLRLTHRGLPGNLRSEYGAGWHDFLDRLVAHMAGSEPSSPWESFEVLLNEYLKRK